MEKVRKLHHTLRCALPHLLFKTRGTGKVVAVTKLFSFLFKNIGAMRVADRYELLALSLGEAPADGMVLEFGVGSGRTIRVIGEVVPDRVVYGFDSFEGLPEPYFSLPKGAYKQSELPEVPDNVEFVIGLFQDTLKGFLKEHTENVAFIHLDADLYSSTKYVLFTLGESHRMVPGTVVQFDEYWSEGEYEAFQEFVTYFGVKFEFVGIVAGRVSIRVLE